MSQVHYPFMFEFTEVVRGKGFLASVKIVGGRALMLQEDEKWWMYGVFPAGLAENGDRPNECFLRFMEGIKAVLFDMASEATTFEEFFAMSNKFLSEKSTEDAQRWTEAQEKLKAGKVKVQDDLSNVPKEPPRPTGHFVERLDTIPAESAPVKFQPQDNIAYTQQPTMAA